MIGVVVPAQSKVADKSVEEACACGAGEMVTSFGPVETTASGGALAGLEGIGVDTDSAEELHPRRRELEVVALGEVAGGEAGVVGVPHPEMGQAVKAFLVPHLTAQSRELTEDI